MTAHVCPVCGRSFQRAPSHVARYATSLCSKACADRAMSSDVAERFWSKVKRGAPDECWPWLASTFEHGYGQFKLAGRNRRAHQVAWELENDRPWPAGADGLHACDFPPCCNPAHVSPGTEAQNAADKVARGRQRPGEQHPRARMSAAQIAAIRSSDEPTSLIAATYDLTTSYVRKIRRGAAWRTTLHEETTDA